MSETIETANKTRRKGLFQKGKSGNPNGRPKGSMDFTSQLKAVIKEVEKEKGISLIKFAVQKAYTNPQVLIALLKKIIPDMSKSDVQVESAYNAAYSEYEKLSDEELIEETERIINYHKQHKEFELDYYKKHPEIMKDDPDNKLTEEEKLILKKGKEKEFEEIKENIED